MENTQNIAIFYEEINNVGLVDEFNEKFIVLW